MAKLAAIIRTAPANDEAVMCSSKNTAPTVIAQMILRNSNGARSVGSALASERVKSRCASAPKAPSRASCVNCSMVGHIQPNGNVASDPSAAISVKYVAMDGVVSVLARLCTWSRAAAVNAAPATATLEPSSDACHAATGFAPRTSAVPQNPMTTAPQRNELTLWRRTAAAIKTVNRGDVYMIDCVSPSDR